MIDLKSMEEYLNQYIDKHSHFDIAYNNGTLNIKYTHTATRLSTEISTKCEQTEIFKRIEEIKKDLLILMKNAKIDGIPFKHRKPITLN